MATIKRIRVDSSILNNGMIKTKVYLTEGDIDSDKIPQERIIRDCVYSEENSEVQDSLVDKLVSKYRNKGYDIM